MSDLKGIYTIYSLNNNYKDLYLFEFLYLAISTHLWKKLNGPTKLICDSVFFDSVKNYGIDWMWDEIDTTTLKLLPNNIDYNIFWTYPKMFAQFKQKERFAIIDADLFINNYLKDFKEDIIYVHEEVDSDNQVYPFQNETKFQDLFEGINPGLNHNAINTSLIVYNNLNILYQLEEITQKFIELCNNDFSHPDKNWIYTIFCEQKVLGNVVKSNGFTYKSIVEKPWDVKGNLVYTDLANNGIDHLWGEKKVLVQNPKQRQFHNNYLLKFIEVKVPELLPLVQPYLNKFIN
jgi:hypothetical protein